MRATMLLLHFYAVVLALFMILELMPLHKIQLLPSVSLVIFSVILNEISVLLFQWHIMQSDSISRLK